MAKQASLFPSDLSQSGAISALIKNIRLRRADEAAKWLLVTWRSGPSVRERAQRRLFISAGEDCLSIPVMQSVSRWFNSPARFDLHAAVRELIRIGRTPNWFASARGRAYVRRWREAELQANPYLAKSADACMAVIEHASLNREWLTAMHAFNSLYGRKDWNRWHLAHLLCRMALETGNVPALQIAELFEDNVRHLWNDANFSGQALATLVFGAIGDPDEVQVTEDELEGVVTRAEALTSDLTTPDFALDGIHCGGSDPRLSGVLEHMAAACTVFERLGRLDPSDDFAAVLRDPYECP